MAVKTVLRMGHPVLKKVAQPVTEFNTPELNGLLTDMFDTMDAMDGAGLAAPQIGVSLRVVVFSVGQNPRYPDAEAVPQTILINPQINPVGERIQEDWEGCLSIPGMRGLVPRHEEIIYRGQDENGQEFERHVSGFHARVVQHEVDHLDGVLYPQRIRDMTQFGFLDELTGHEY